MTMKPQAGRLLRDTSGVAAIEFGILALPFFLLIFAIIEIGLVFAGELTLDNAVDRIGRDLRTGQIQTGDPTREEFAEMVCERVSFLFDCDGLRIDLAAYDDYASVSTSIPAVPRYDIGESGQIVTLIVDYDWPIFTHLLRVAMQNGDGAHKVTAMAAFQAEVF